MAKRPRGTKRALLLVISSVLFLSACGGGSSDSSSGAAKQPSSINQGDTESAPRPGDTAPTTLIDGIALAPVSEASSVSAKIGYAELAYGEAFDIELDTLGEISVDEFHDLYAPELVQYRSGISWDVRTASFWQELLAIPIPSPFASLSDSGYSAPEYRDAGERCTTLFDMSTQEHCLFANVNFSLNEREQEIMQRNGFVVSERLASRSFAGSYYEIFYNDLPVFITTDSILHAWHRSYDAILEETEEQYLTLTILNVLESMVAELPDLFDEAVTELQRQSLLDADLFLSVAISLFLGTDYTPKYGDLEQLQEITQAVYAEQLSLVSLFGVQRKIDFSHFKPRGHYTESMALQRYFRAMKWLGRIDMRIASQDPHESSIVELAAAIALGQLLERSQMMEQWQQIDAVLQTYVGQVDSLTPTQLYPALSAASIQTIADVNETTLADLQYYLLMNNGGLQQIASRDASFNPFDTKYAELPFAFTLFGERFTIDSWAQSKTLHHQVEWQGEDVVRKISSAIDVAFSVLGNDAVVPEIASRIEDSDGVPWRDGLSYQHNLVAARRVVEQRSDEDWLSSIYDSWLYTLQALSEPTTGPQFPEVMRTQAWSQKTLNTQLASWAQLRHDTILYVKQPSVNGAACYYPEGYVEPRLEFWRRMEAMVRNSALALQKLTFSGPKPRVELLSETQEKQVNFLQEFADTVADLHEIAAKQLNDEELNDQEQWYLENVVELTINYMMDRSYNGWYPQLFYKGEMDSEKWDSIVADVQTANKDPNHGYPGAILHEGIGFVNTMFIAIESEDDKVIYLGPTLSHYEFQTKLDGRLSDDDWTVMLEAGNAPEREDRYLPFLVPDQEFVPLGVNWGL